MHKNITKLQAAAATAADDDIDDYSATPWDASSQTRNSKRESGGNTFAGIGLFVCVFSVCR